MTDLPIELLDRMADAARARADLWELCKQAVARPTVEWVEQLRTGGVGQRLERDTVWLGESVDVGDLVAALGAYVGRTGRFTSAQDLAELEGEWARVVADDAVEARAARATQHDALREAFEPMQDWCRSVYSGTHVLVVKVLAEVVAAHVGFELGRDLRKSLDPGSRARLVLEQAAIDPGPRVHVGVRRLQPYDVTMIEGRLSSNSRARQFVEVGGIELTLGGLWLLSSVQAVVSGQFSGLYFVTDLLAFVALGLGTRTLAFGLGGMALALMVALLLPPGAHGYVGVFAFIMVITLVRRRRLWLALGLTVVTLLVGTWLSYRASDEVSLAQAGVAWFLASMIAWALSLGSRAQAQLSVLNEREKHVRERVDFAWDLHDFVARDLTIISMRLDSAIARGGAGVEELQLIAEHSRAANKFLRETAKQFGDASLSSQHRAVTISSAIETIRAELERTGRELIVPDECPSYPRMVDAVGGRILLEALHNAVKHGTGPITVTCAAEGDVLEIVVRNQTAGRAAKASRGMGLAAMRQRAAMFGGELVTGPLDGDWVSTIRLPFDEHTIRGIKQ